MRLFQSERIAKLMDRMGLEEGEVIQHSMVTKSIERAQKKVEENNFGIRKRLLEYDDVMNIQREAIYKKRKNALSGDRLSVDLNTMFNSLTEDIVIGFREAENYQGFKRASLSVLGVDPKIEEGDFRQNPVEELVEGYQAQVREQYDRRHDAITATLLPVIKDVYNTERHRYKRIAIPFVSSQGTQLPIAADIEQAVKSNGESVKLDIEKAVTLALIDEKWKEHLRSMDELKEASQAASFEQKDPLVVYKMEAYKLFENLVYNINEEVSSYLMKGRLVLRQDRSLQEAREQKTDLSKTQTNKDASDEAARARAAAEGVSRRRSRPSTFRRRGKKVGRNEPCPCGSGKKFKHCHGRSSRQ